MCLSLAGEKIDFQINHETRHKEFTYQIKQYGISEDDDDEDHKMVLEIKGDTNIKKYINDAKNGENIYGRLSEEERIIFEDHMDVSDCQCLDYSDMFVVLTDLFIEIIEKCKERNYRGYY